MTTEKTPSPDVSAILASAGVTRSYSTKEVAAFFDRTDQWVYWVLRDGVERENGTPIEPERVGKSQRRRFTIPIIKEIAVALYRRGTIDEAKLTGVLTDLGNEERK